MVLVVAVALGVLGLGGVLVALVRKQSDTAADGSKPPAEAAASAGQAAAAAPGQTQPTNPAAANDAPPSLPDVTGTGAANGEDDDIPEVRTVRIAPEPPVADREWQPPAHAVEQPGADTADSTDKTNGVPAGRDVSRREERDRDARRAEREKRAGKGGKREPPPAPASAGTTKPEPAGTAAGAAQGSGSSVGRLGVQMKPDEF
jgi:hypothetical protein